MVYTEYNLCQMLQMLTFLFRFKYLEYIFFYYFMIYFTYPYKLCLFVKESVTCYISQNFIFVLYAFSSRYYEATKVHIITSNVTPSEYFKLKELFGKAPSWFRSVTVHKLNQVSLRSLLSFESH